MKPSSFFLLAIVALLTNVDIAHGQEIHVAKHGSDQNNGTKKSPFLTISKAASVAVPGNTIMIHEGTYREYIDPARGGSSPSNRITYRAADKAQVYIKGSEEFDTWEKQANGLWKLEVPISFFKGYNPYTLTVDGDFQNYGQWHHRGDVYLNNGAFHEVQSLEECQTKTYTWYTTSTEETTIIYANFEGYDPNKEQTEINVRELIFFPSRLNIDYISLDGLRFLHAAPNWQAPNVGETDPNPLTQKGAIGSKMGQGWIIENCEVSYSKTAGIMMGESFDDFDSFENIETFGNHLIKNNIITKCGEYGIAGQKGLSRSTIIGNRIEDINYRNEFGGYEPAGIKIWNCTDVHIENNLIRNITSKQDSSSQSYCIWIDFANQGTRITRNFLIGGERATTPLFLEANIGPTLVDNNVIIDLPSKAVQVFSGGSIFAHNLFIDTNFHFAIQEFGNGGSGARNAYTVVPHTLKKVNDGLKVEIENNKFYNNIFVGKNGSFDLEITPHNGNEVAYNLYVGGIRPNKDHKHSAESPFDFTYRIKESKKGLSFKFRFDRSYENINAPFVDPDLIGQIPHAEQSIADKSATPITVNTDFNGSRRIGAHPKVGPLESLSKGTNTLHIETAMQPTPGIKY
ncbi:right-handed parallel beta-helix repeat-containing protein [Zobellia galactanivorans]|uniref:Uncharacterized protein n=1 Tax=Zobellia galactanivorans (strain DSM 12802 / CCUG 47099 / CIP 106680 / NCIMB 13871 / Dsij) TaxID=63186 RepID=G0L2B6_ZOBGA|nr:right-handed parallel beta-helix repeat-containing protein [Zobellia galactanivorans]CAZ98030.1 Conserved hypothetical protein [Zobellia galactanivorans]